MKLTLKVSNEDKIFTAPFVSGRHFRKLAEFDETMDYSKVGVEEMDVLVGFVCEVFNNQFDIDTFYDGIPAHEVISTIMDVFVYVRTGKTSEELSESLEEGNEQGE